MVAEVVEFVVVNTITRVRTLHRWTTVMARSVRNARRVGPRPQQRLSLSPVPVNLPRRGPPARWADPRRPLISPYLPPVGMPLVQFAEPSRPADSKEAQQDEQQRRDDGYDACQAGDGGHLAAEGLRADVPSLRPVGADIFVVRGGERWDRVVVWDAGLSLLGCILVDVSHSILSYLLGIAELWV